jgi:hypothetical protein
MIKVIEVMENDAAYPIELEAPSGRLLTGISKADAIQLIADLQNAVINLE